jgi:hypothetical protein
MKKGLLTCLVVILVIFGLIIAGVAAMFFAKICPPQGPWPMPPWCGEDSRTFSIPVPPMPPQDIPSIEEISEIPTLPKIALTEAPELEIEKAVVIPTRVDEIPYPEFYNNPTFTKAVVKDPYCALVQAQVAYPAEYLGSYEFPAVNGAPLPETVTRSIGIKDVWIAEPNLNNCPFIIPYEKMRQSLDSTLERVKALGGEEITFSNYIHFIEFEKPLLQSPSQAAIPEADLRYIAGKAEEMGLGMTLYLNLAPGNVKTSWEIPGDEWLAELINQWEVFVVDQARLAEETGIDAMMINHFDYQPGIGGFEGVYQSEMLELLGKVHSVYSGRVLLMIEPAMGADLNKLSDLLNAVDGFIYTPYTNILENAPDKTVSVQNLKVLYAGNLKEVGREFGRYQKPFLLRVLVQSEKEFLEKGWNEDMFCIERDGDPCYQKNLTVDFSLQAVAMEAMLEAVSQVERDQVMAIENIDIYGYWFTDVILPDFSQPQMAHSIRNKPAESVVYAWFKR